MTKELKIKTRNAAHLRRQIIEQKRYMKLRDILGRKFEPWRYPEWNKWSNQAMFRLKKMNYWHWVIKLYVWCARRYRKYAPASINQYAGLYN
jgi:hypothetical protein